MAERSDERRIHGGFMMHARELVGMRGIDQHQRGNPIGMSGRIGLDIQGADRMSDEDVGRPQAQCLQQLVELGGYRRRLAWRFGGSAAVVTGATVGQDLRTLGYATGNAVPRRKAIAEAGLEHHYRCSLALRRKFHTAILYLRRAHAGADGAGDEQRLHRE